MNSRRLAFILGLSTLLWVQTSLTEYVGCEKVHDGVECEGQVYVEPEHKLAAGDATFWIYIAVSIVLVLLAGLFSGLTIGLMSLDPMNLRILRNSGTPTERKYASRLMPLLEKHHFLLVTLLLANAIVMEALPVFLDAISTPLVAIVISVSCVLLFGEIIPQAICTRWALAIGGNLAWFVNLLMWGLCWISWPIGKLLDLVVGHETLIFYERFELKELVSIHAAENHGPLTPDECTIIRGALDMKQKKIKDIMTRLSLVYMLDCRTLLTLDVLKQILETGHSRVPIYDGERENIVGILLVKTLISVREPVPVKDLPLRPILTVPFSTPLFDVLNLFQTGKSHMVAVSDEDHRLLGIATLEDVIEELIQEEIIDETDVFIDVERSIKVSRLLRPISKPDLKDPEIRPAGTSRETLHTEIVAHSRTYGSLP